MLFIVVQGWAAFSFTSSALQANSFAHTVMQNLLKYFILSNIFFPFSSFENISGLRSSERNNKGSVSSLSKSIGHGNSSFLLTQPLWKSLCVSDNWPFWTMSIRLGWNTVLLTPNESIWSTCSDQPMTVSSEYDFCVAALGLVWDNWFMNWKKEICVKQGYSLDVASRAEVCGHFSGLVEAEWRERKTTWCQLVEAFSNWNKETTYYVGLSAHCECSQNSSIWALCSAGGQANTQELIMYLITTFFYILDSVWVAEKTKGKQESHHSELCGPVAKVLWLLRQRAWVQT